MCTEPWGEGVVVLRTVKAQAANFLGGDSSREEEEGHGGGRTGRGFCPNTHCLIIRLGAISGGG